MSYVRRSVVYRWLGRHSFHAVGVIIVCFLVASSLLAPAIAPHDPLRQDLSVGLSPPSRLYPFGTDQLGRDMLSRILWAGRVSLSISGTVLLLSLALGAVVGSIAGYGGGVVDDACMRIVDLFLALPTFVFALALIGTLGTGTQNLVLALAISRWPLYARLVRSSVRTVRLSDYVLAAECLGFPPSYIMRRYLLPAPLGLVAIQLSLDVGQVMLAIAALGFLGLGIAPPQPEWGTMLVDARPFMQEAPHLVFAPGLAVFFTVLGCTAVSEMLELWLNPHI